MVETKCEATSGAKVAAPVEGEKKKPCCGCKGKGKKVKPSQLPLYGNPYPPKDVIRNPEPGLIQESVQNIRHSLTPYFEALDGTTKRGKEMLNTAVDHSKATYEMITDEGNAVPKAMAITAGGLTGLLLASRRGFIKKVLYPGIGMGVVAAACYPKQTGELAEVSLYIVKNKGPQVVMDYTGYDISPYIKGSERPKKSGAPVQGATPVKETEAAESGRDVPKGPGLDQGSPEDKDLYTTRSNK